MDEFTVAFKRVIRDWGVFDIFLVVVFFPWSFLYILFRLIQEWPE